MKNNTTTQIIAKEGWKYSSLFFFLFLVSLYLEFLPWVFLVLFLFSLFIFRNPERVPNEDDEYALLSPCDGEISDIKKVNAFGSDFIMIQIDKSIWDVSLLRSPTKVNIINTTIRHGLFLSINSSLSKKLSESATMECSSNFGKLYMRIIAGVLARKIELFKTIGPLRVSSRFGLLVDGCVELYIPVESRVSVTIGDRVEAVQTTLGYFALKGKDSEQ